MENLEIEKLKKEIEELKRMVVIQKTRADRATGENKHYEELFTDFMALVNKFGFEQWYR